jgi:hypothetical protein
MVNRKVWYAARQLSGSSVRRGLGGSVGCGDENYIGRYVREDVLLVVV